MHVILKGVTKFNKIDIIDDHSISLNTDDNEIEDGVRVPDAALYEKKHVCRLNRIEIKDPNCWDTAEVKEEDTHLFG